MKSNSTGRSMARARSAMNTNAPLSTHDEQRRPAGVVGGDLGAELGDAGLELVGGDDDRAEVRVVVAGAMEAPDATARCAGGPTVRADADGRRRRRWRRPRRGRRRAPARRRRGRAGAPRRRWPCAATRAAPGGRAATGAAATARGVGRVDGSAASASRRAASAAARSASRHSSGHDVAAGDVVEQRQHLVADAVAAEARVVVATGRRPGRGRASAHSACVSARRSARIGWRGPGRQGGEAVEPGAAQQGEQHRLGLVVGGVAGACVGRQHARSGRPGPGPRGRARRRPSTRSARNAAPNRPPRPRDDVGLGGRPGPQPVVDVHRGDVAAGRDGQHQQRERVGAARHRARRARVPGGGNAQRARSWRSVGVDRRRGRRATSVEQLGAPIATLEAAGDAAEAGVDVRPAQPRSAAASHHRRRRRARPRAARAASSVSAATSGARSRGGAAGGRAARARRLRGR